MGDSYGLDTTYSVLENPINDKVVVSTKKDGIDQVEMAKKLMDAKKTIAKLDTKKISEDAKKLTALEQLGTLVSAFNAANEPLMNYFGVDATRPNAFRDLCPTFSSVNGVDAQNYVTASADISSNVIGSQYSLQVTQVAKMDLLQSTTSLSTPSAAYGLTGNLYINNVAIAIVGTDSLNDIVNKINAQSALTNVTVYTSQISPTNTNVMLTLQGTSLTTPIDLTPNALDVTAINPVTSLSLPASAVYNGNAGNIAAHQQTLQAAVILNGNTYYRSDNVITDLIQGVTITAVLPMPAATTLSFKLDTASITQATVDWINAYNGVKSFLKTHLTKATDDDPQGQHVLYRNPIVENTLRMLNQIDIGVDGFVDRFGQLSSYSIGFTNPSDIASTLTYDSIKLPQLISSNTNSFLKLMGQYYTSTNPKFKVLDLPSNLPTSLAGTPLSLTISNVTVNGSGKTVFDARLSCGSYSETLTAISGQVMNFVDPKNFGGFSIEYVGTLPGAGLTDTGTITTTQGISARLNTRVGTYLEMPFDVEELSKLKVSDLSQYDWGDLSKEMFIVYRDKKNLEQKVERANKNAEDVYLRSLRDLQKASNNVDKNKLIKDMINQMSNPRR